MSAWKEYRQQEKMIKAHLADMYRRGERRRQLLARRVRDHPILA